MQTVFLLTLAGILSVLTHICKAQQNTPPPVFVVEPHNISVSVCNCTTDEEVTVHFQCAANHAARIWWMMNETSMDQAYEHNTNNGVAYSSTQYNIIGSTESQTMVQCKAMGLNRKMITSEVAIISVICCGCPGQDIKNGNGTGAGLTGNTTDTTSCTPTDDSKKIALYCVMVLSLSANVLFISILLALFLCRKSTFYKWKKSTPPIAEDDDVNEKDGINTKKNPENQQKKQQNKGSAETSGVRKRQK